MWSISLKRCECTGGEVSRSFARRLSPLGAMQIYCRSRGFQLSSIFLIKSLIARSKSSFLSQERVGSSSRGLGKCSLSTSCQVVQYEPPRTFWNSKNVSSKLQFRRIPAWLNWVRVFFRKKSIPRVPLSMQTSALAFLLWNLYFSGSLVLSSHLHSSRKMGSSHSCLPSWLSKTMVLVGLV